MSKVRYSLPFSLVLLAACESKPRTAEPPRLEQAFPHLPLPPSPQLVSQSGGADALQLTLRSPAELAQVEEYYRSILSQGNWRLVSDMRNADGSTALYAEQDGPPLWVRIWKAKDRPGTMVRLTGAVPGQNRADSAKPRS